MSITYGWFLVPTLGIERTIEFVRTIPNSGITEIVDRKLVDLFKRGRKVTTEPSDGGDSKGPFVKMVLAEARRHARGGSIGYDVGSNLELAHCILVEGLGKKAKSFDGYVCHDLESKLWGVRDVIKELDEPDPTLVGLEETLDRALTLHIAVMFDQ